MGLLTGAAFALLYVIAGIPSAASVIASVGAQFVRSDLAVAARAGENLTNSATVSDANVRGA